MREFDEIDRFFKALEGMMDGNFTGGYGIPPESHERIDSSDRGVDIFEDEENIYITLELRVPDDDLKVIPKEEELSIEIMSDGIWKKKSFKLPTKVDPKTAKIKIGRASCRERV